MKPLNQFQITSGIIRSKLGDLTTTEKMVLVCISDRFNYKPSLGFPDKLVSYESQESISKATNTTKSTVSRCVKTLKEKGYIEVVKKSNGLKNYNVYIWCGDSKLSKINQDKVVDSKKVVMHNPVIDWMDEDEPPF